MVFLSGWQDSNLRPPAPKAGAMTGLRYTPIDTSYFAFRKTKRKYISKFINPIRNECLLQKKNVFAFFFNRNLQLKERFINPLLSSIKKIIFKTEIVLLNTQILEESE